MTTMKLQNIGQITEANIEFGDLTVFVGPQATGKSIALQFLKLMVDAGQVQAELVKHGLDWGGNLGPFLDVYLGEGMQSIWNKDKSQVVWEGKNQDLDSFATGNNTNKSESLFYIPAQRVLALRDGWPRPFSDYSPGDPFAVREFSERLRVLMEQDFIGSELIFPQSRRMSDDFSQLLEKHVFSTFHLQVNKVHSQKRLVLGSSGEPLPYMVWSAGQREFVPLLLGFYRLMPLPPDKNDFQQLNYPTAATSSSKTLGAVKWVVLEEPEMGLHPRAITVVLLMVFDLVQRGYQVCVSTHSPHVLEAIWALRQLRQNHANAGELLDAFETPKTQPMQFLAQSMLEKDVRVFYFDRDNGRTKDISDLDPTKEEEGESGWGGLTEFSGRVNAAVAKAVANS